MQQSADLHFARPNPVGLAYNTVIRQTESPRDIEYRIFAQITAALQEAASPNTHFLKRIHATHRNRELWQTLAVDLAGDGNMLPKALRAQLVSLSIWVVRTTSKAQKGGQALQDLIDVNLSVMQGLKPQGQQAA